MWRQEIIYAPCSNNIWFDYTDGPGTHLAQFVAPDNVDYSTSQTMPTRLHKRVEFIVIGLILCRTSTLGTCRGVWHSYISGGYAGFRILFTLQKFMKMKLHVTFYSFRFCYNIIVAFTSCTNIPNTTFLYNAQHTCRGGGDYLGHLDSLCCSRPPNCTYSFISFGISVYLMTPSWWNW